jgi:hypothetical protein
MWDLMLPNVGSHGGPSWLLSDPGSHLLAMPEDLTCPAFAFGTVGRQIPYHHIDSCSTLEWGLSRCSKTSGHLDGGSSSRTLGLERM